MDELVDKMERKTVIQTIVLTFITETIHFLKNTLISRIET